MAIGRIADQAYDDWNKTCSKHQYTTYSYINFLPYQAKLGRILSVKKIDFDTLHDSGLGHLDDNFSKVSKESQEFQLQLEKNCKSAPSYRFLLDITDFDFQRKIVLKFWSVLNKFKESNVGRQNIMVYNLSLLREMKSFGCNHVVMHNELESYLTQKDMLPDQKFLCIDFSVKYGFFFKFDFIENVFKSLDKKTSNRFNYEKLLEENERNRILYNEFMLQKNLNTNISNPKDEQQNIIKRKI